MRRRRTEVLETAVAKSKTFRFRVCPHHDASSAVGLAVYFDDIEMAKGIPRRLASTGRSTPGRHKNNELGITLGEGRPASATRSVRLGESSD